jgi:hypothetical protein
MPGNPHDCREHAKNCLRLAHEAKTPEAVAHFEGLAKRWMELATDLEIAHRLLEETGVPPREPKD